MPSHRASSPRRRASSPRRRSVSPRRRASSPRRRSVSPHAHRRSVSPHHAHAHVAHTGRASSPCPASKPFRSEKTGKCYAGATPAGRQAGVCPSKPDRTGKISEYVAAFVGGRHRCLKAGGAAAKAALGEKGCPAGKALVSVKVRLPDGHVTTAKRCVAPRGEYADKKTCLVGQVLAETTRRGVTPHGQSWEKRVRICVTPATAASKGYRVVSQGSVVKPFKVHPAHAAAHAMAPARRR